MRLPVPVDETEPPAAEHLDARRLLSRLFWFLLMMAIVAYGGLGTWFAINETRFVYHPSRQMTFAEELPGFHCKRVELWTSDHVRLVGWELRSAAGDSSGAWLLYFHGNAGNISGWTGRYAHFAKLGVNVFTADYRGYGESEGHPDEQGLYRDAEAMYGHVADALRIPPRRILLYGHSLGAAVAIELASRREAAGLVLEGAFTSLPARGQELYPYIPVRLLARNHFDSIDKVGSLRLPKLFIHASDDSVIPYAHGQELFTAAAPPKVFLTLRGGHSVGIIRDGEKFLKTMGGFLADLHLVPGAQVRDSLAH